MIGFQKFIEPRNSMLKVLYRNYLVWSHHKIGSVVANLGEPLLYLLSIGYGLGRYIQSIDGMPYIDFMVPALVMISVMNSTSFETTFSSYTRMTVQRTFEAIAVTPVGLRNVILGEILWAATKATFGAAIMLLVFAIAGLIHHWHVLAILPFAFLIGLLFAALGVFATSIARSYEFFNYYFVLFLTPMFLFSGTFFPLKDLPNWAYRLGYVLPLTRAVYGSREIFSGRWGSELWISISGCSILLILVTILAVKRMEKRLVF